MSIDETTTETDGLRKARNHEVNFRANKARTQAYVVLRERYRGEYDEAYRQAREQIALARGPLPGETPTPVPPIDVA